RPDGAPTAENFRMETEPVAAPTDGQILLRTVYLSLDPYMRGRMSEGPSYVPPVAIGAVMGAGTVSRVVTSRHAGFVEGDWVLNQGGWQEFSVSDGKGVVKLGAQMDHPSSALGVLGMPGFTATIGLLEIGKPKAGETVVVAAATGAVGSVVGQIAKLKGCHVVGVAGGAEKCRYAVEELGFDACVDHREAGLAQALAQACPKGIDVYFENVGGAVFQAVLPLLNAFARIPLCGLISQYNQSHPREGIDNLPRAMGIMLKQRISLQGFIISAYYERHYAEFLKQMSEWLASGAIKYREQIVEGLENTPEAFMGMLVGKNFGKLVVRVSSDDAK
ncbi:MAG: NADP-dependent oxidoreductase, partial [Bryocella sp.]